MESNNTEDELSIRRGLLLKIQESLDKLKSDRQTSESSTLTSLDLQKINNEVQQLVKNPTKTAQDPKASLRIHDDLDKVFDAEEVGHSCDLCQRDLARDPERLNGSLCSLQEACVLACGHVYHFKCLKGTTLDLDNSSKDPSCIFCIS